MNIHMDKPFLEKHCMVLSFLRHAAFILPILLFISCKQEIAPSSSESSLRYHPIGENKFIEYSATNNNHTLYSIVNGMTLYKTSGKELTKIWETELDAIGKEVIACKNGSVIVIKASPFSNNEITYCRIDADRIISHNTTGLRLMPNYQDYQEHFISGCGDGNNGAYLLVALQKFGIWPENMKGLDVFLIHINESNQVESRMSLKNHFLRLASDKEGNLYGLSFKDNDMSISGTSKKDSFMMVSFNKASLAAGKIDYNYISSFVQTEYWANYYWEREFGLEVNSSQVYIAMPQVKAVDLEIGLDMLQFDKKSGKITQTWGIASPTVANKYWEGAKLNTFANEKGFYAVYRIGATTQLVYMRNDGSYGGKLDLKGNKNRCDILDIEQLGENILVMGFSSLAKSPILAPFAYEITELN